MEGLNINATTFAGQNAANSGVMKRLWSDVAKSYALIADPVSRLEGNEGSGACVQVRRELQNAAGTDVTFTQMAGLGGGQVRGETPLEGNEDTVRSSSWAVRCDYRRYGVGWTKKLASRMAVGRSLPEWTAQQMGSHYAWWKARETMLKWRNEAISRNIFWVGNGGTLSGIKSAHTLSARAVLDCASFLQFINAKPCDINAIAKNVGGASTVHEIWRYVFMGENSAFNALALDSTYQAAVNAAFVNGLGSINFSGQFADWRGQAIYPFTSPNNDQIGPVGSPLAPFAYLGANTGATVGTDVINLASGQTPVLYGSRERSNPTTFVNDTKTPFFVDFPGYMFPYDDATTSSGVAGGVWNFADANQDYFALIFNPDDRKFGFVKYRRAGFAANANTLQIVARVTSSATTMAGSTVAYASGPWSGKISDRHPAGAWIFPCTSDGVPLEFLGALGADSAARAYGSEMKELAGSGDYGMKISTGYETDYGTAICPNFNGDPANYALMVMARNLPSIGLPAIV